MRAALALSLLLAAPALSGCIDGVFVTGEEPVAGPKPLIADWYAVPALHPVPENGVLNLWVPNGTQALRVHPPAELASSHDEEDDEDDDDDDNVAPIGHGVGVDGPGSAQGLPSSGTSAADGADAEDALTDFSKRFVLMDPDGRWLLDSSESTSVDPGIGPDFDPFDYDYDVPIDLESQPLLTIDDPVPGVYRVLLYGGSAPPAIELLVGPDLRVPAMHAGPLFYDRIHLFGGNPAGAANGISAGGTIDPAPGTALLVPDMRGAGADAELTFYTANDTVLAQFRQPAALDPVLLPELTLGLASRLVPPVITQHPQHLDTERVDFTADGIGYADGFAYAGIASVLAAPYAQTVDERRSHGLFGADVEDTDLQGDIGPRDAAWFDNPAEAVLQIEADDSDEEVRFRVYDRAGHRLAWGTAEPESAPFPIPPGPIVIINDGPGRLEAQLFGTSPADATLRELDMIDAQTLTLDPGMSSDYSETTQRLLLPGPAIDVWANWLGPIDGPLVTFERSADGAPLATIPRDPNPAHEGFCCNTALFGGADGDAHWLDAGIYHVRGESLAAPGSIDVYVRYLDLSQIDP